MSEPLQPTIYNSLPVIVFRGVEGVEAFVCKDRKTALKEKERLETVGIEVMAVTDADCKGNNFEEKQRYQVTVGNPDNNPFNGLVVYNGNNADEASKAFGKYVKKSECSKDKIAGQVVTLIASGKAVYGHNSITIPHND